MSVLVVCAVVIRDGRILLAEDKEGNWILPGGKVEEGQTENENLAREINEELSGAMLDNIDYFGDFTGLTPNSGREFRLKVYLADITGEVQASGEIRQIQWVRYENLLMYNISSVAQKVIFMLRNFGHL